MCLQVDLLGDEVEALLGILEEVQIAFDIYAPVLHHYPKVRFALVFILHNSSPLGCCGTGHLLTTIELEQKS